MQMTCIIAATDAVGCAGPSGASVREVVRLTGADINSWTEPASNLRGRRPARIFLIKASGRVCGTKTSARMTSVRPCCLHFAEGALPWHHERVLLSAHYSKQEAWNPTWHD
jgi:hypothetical protein